MRYLGIDLGTKTLGLSMTDMTNTLVRPLPVYRFNFEDYNSAVEEVKKIVVENNIGLVILGLPKNMDGSIGFAGKRSINFKNMLNENNINVELIDERMTTIMAEDIVHSNNENVKSTKNKIDSIAACLILESYLKRIKNDNKE